MEHAPSCPCDTCRLMRVEVMVRHVSALCEMVLVHMAGQESGSTTMAEAAEQLKQSRLRLQGAMRQIPTPAPS